MPHTPTSVFAVRHIPAGLLLGVRSLTPSALAGAGRTVVRLLRHPRHAGSPSGPVTASDPWSPYLLLVLSFFISFVRIVRDPGVEATAELMGIGTLLPLWMVLTAGGAVIGAILMPAFWYRVLRLPSRRDAFIGGMVCMYASVVIPWDMLSIVWIPVLREAGTPLWLPETVKTALITVYCSVAGMHMPASADGIGTEGP
ncbi:MAG: hypothetical protein ACKOB6_07900 [Candidatus Kapaibacterium sp.]